MRPAIRREATARQTSYGAWLLLLLSGAVHAVVPTAPTNLTATAISTTQINLSWTDTSNNETSFKIERKTGASGTYAQIATVGTNVTTFNNTGLASSTTYFYRVRASNSSGNSAYTNAASATTQAPDTTAPTAPTGLTATTTRPNQIDLSWTAATDNVAVTGYYLARCHGAGCTTYETFSFASTTGTTFSDIGLPASMSYTYQVRAHDAAGNVGPYATVSATTLSTVSGPVAAYAFDEGTGTTTTDFSGNNNSGTLGTGVTWSTQGRFGGALVFNGSSLVTVPHTASLNLTNGMTLEAWVFPTATSTGSPTVVSKDWISQLSAYGLRSRAYSNGPSIFFATTDGIPLGINGPPDLPLNTWSHLAGTYDATTTTMSVYINGALTLSGGMFSGPQMLTTTGALRIGGSTVAGANDFFTGRIDEVRIYNRALSQAEIQADMTNPVAGPPPDTTAPTAPGVLTASTVSTGQINLAWAASTDNVGVTGYVVDRCLDSACTSFVQILVPGATSFSDTGLSAGTTYYYRVRAIDAAGNLSAYSNIISVTTPNAQMQAYYIVPDHLNTPRIITNQQGVTVWRWDQQEAFGSTPPNNNPSGLGAFDFPLRFPGQYFDRETNLAYNYFRDYDSGIGRYVEADPVGSVLFEALALSNLGMLGLSQREFASRLYSNQPRYNHLYAYVSGSPLAGSDFYGLLDPPGGGGGGGGVPGQRCPLVQQIGPVGVAYWVGLPRFLFICVYNCGAKCPPAPNDLVYLWVWIWNWPFKCQPDIRASS